MVILTLPRAELIPHYKVYLMNFTDKDVFELIKQTKKQRSTRITLIYITVAE
jgi:hypothetical protein